MDILAKTFTETAAYVKDSYGQGMEYASAFYKAVFQGTTDFNLIPAIAKNRLLTARLQAETLLSQHHIDVFRDGTVEKFITHCDDGEYLESVIIPHKNRSTLCVSSQIGCRMGCVFCSTGTSGFVRNATVAEITGQLYTARVRLKKAIDNIVFMGMGEPLDNVEAVIQAINVISDQRGFNIPLRSITVSTAGHVAGMQKLAGATLSTLKIAVSINAADNVLRSRLMPINNAFPLQTLKQALRDYPLTKRGTFLIEYVLIDGINDSKAAAADLAVFVAGLPVRINVIGLNPGITTTYRAPSNAVIRQFCTWLVEKKLFVRQRTSHGSGIMAACGQLRAAVAS